MMPFWVNTGFAVPGTGGPFGIGARPLLVPVSHAEYEWQVRGPQINADISYYYGIDGKSEWRTMDTLDQAWVLKRAAHTYTGAQAVEVTRLAGLLTVAYMHQHQRRPDLPFGGYYTLGVCQDGVAAIEHRMTGRTTLFPNTADTSLFDDPRDAEVNALIAAIPKDRDGAPTEPERIFGSLPATSGADDAFTAITIPGLADDLQLSYAAWRTGKLHRIHSRSFYWTIGCSCLRWCGRADCARSSSPQRLIHEVHSNRDTAQATKNEDPAMQRSWCSDAQTSREVVPTWQPRRPAARKSPRAANPQPRSPPAARKRAVEVLRRQEVGRSKKSSSKKSSRKKSSSKKSSGRKYSKGAGKQVKREMHEMHQGKLKSGRSGKKVTNRKQAIAIGLSEARKKGEKVPPNPNK